MSLKMYGNTYLCECPVSQMYGMKIGDTESVKIALAVETLRKFYSIEPIQAIMYETDGLKVQSFKSWVRLVVNGNMKAIDLLFAKREIFSYWSPNWESLHLSRTSFVGYAPVCERTLKFFNDNFEKSFKPDNSGEQVCGHGYRRRTLAAGFRAMAQAYMLITNGIDYDCSAMEEQDVKMVSEIRDGVFTVGDINDATMYVKNLLDYAVKHSAIDQFPSIDHVDSICESVYRKVHMT